jgi:REP element-mobilizing transposase RayT
MARPLRVEFAGALYHVTARGNERRAVFRDDEDRQRFLATLEESLEESALLSKIIRFLDGSVDGKTF